MKEISWAITILLFVVFLLLSSGNGIVFWDAYVRRKKTASWIPIMGGACGTLSLTIMPIPGARWWWWLPLLLDWGSFPGLLVSIVYWVTHSRRNS